MQQNKRKVAPNASIGSSILLYKKLDLSSNSLELVVDTDWIPPFSLKVALLASCQMGHLFPAWLQWQLEITKLDISSTTLMDKIPDWFWDTFSHTIYMDISDNQLSGSLPAHLIDMAFVELNMSSNLLTGPIPPLPRNITVLDMSKIHFQDKLYNSDSLIIVLFLFFVIILLNIHL